MDGSRNAEPDKVDDVKRAFAENHAGSLSRLGKDVWGEKSAQGSEVLLTNVVPYLTPMFIHEHARVLLTFNLFLTNRLRQRGLSFVKPRLEPLGSPRRSDDWSARIRGKREPWGPGLRLA